MKCNNCGFVTECNFCPMCGTQLKSTEENQAVDKSVDSVAFQNIASDQNEVNFQPTPIEANFNVNMPNGFDNSNNSSKKNKKSGLKKTVMVIAGAVVFAVIAGGIGTAVYSAATNDESYYEKLDYSLSTGYKASEVELYNAMSILNSESYETTTPETFDMDEKVELANDVTLSVVSVEPDAEYKKGSDGNTKWTATFEIDNKSGSYFKACVFDCYLMDKENEESFEWLSSDYEIDDDYYSLIVKAQEKITIKYSYSVPNDHGKMGLNIYFYEIEHGNSTQNDRDLLFDVKEK